MNTERIKAIICELGDYFRFNTITPNDVMNWVNKYEGEDYTIAMAVLAKSVIYKTDIKCDILLPNPEDVIVHHHLIEGAIKEKKVSVRVFDTVTGYITMNLFTGSITRLGNNKDTWDWYEN